VDEYDPREGRDQQREHEAEEHAKHEAHPGSIGRAPRRRI
jgi:hypothetical protein